MAACDKLYGTIDQWQELHDFLFKNKPEYLIFMRVKPFGRDIDCICYTADIQGYLYENCPIQWVKDALETNFEVQTMICGKPHHE